MSIERVSGESEIRLLRDPSLGMGTSHYGKFTLEAIQSFAIEAEIAGVNPKDTMWFFGGTPEYIYFPFPGHHDYTPSKSVATIDQKTYILTLTQLRVFSALSGLGIAIAFVLGYLL